MKKALTTEQCLEWLLRNRALVNLSEIARQSGAPLQALKYFANGERGLAERWHGPVSKVIADLVKI